MYTQAPAQSISLFTRLCTEPQTQAHTNIAHVQAYATFNPFCLHNQVVMTSKMKDTDEVQPPLCPLKQPFAVSGQM